MDKDNLNTTDLHKPLDEIKKEDSTETPKTEETKVEAKAEDKKTLTQADFDKALTRRLNEDRVKSEEKTKKAVDEALSISKLKGDERAEAEAKKRQADIDERQQALDVREAKIEAKDSLQKRNLDSEFVDFVVDVDSSAMADKIDKLESIFNNAVEKKINGELKGETPTDTIASDNKPSFHSNESTVL